MKHAILAAAIALVPISAAAQSLTPTLDMALAPVLADAVRVRTVDPTMDLPDTRLDLSLPASSDYRGPIMYHIPGISTYPQPYTPEPPAGSGAPYQPRW